MPFHYDLPLPKLGEERSGAGAVKLVSWLVEEGALLARGTPVAIVSTENSSYEVRANGDGADSDDVDQSFRSHADQIGAKRRKALLV